MKVIEICDILKKRFGTELEYILCDKEVEIENLLTDSRNHFSPGNTLFFAIKTEGGNDGHHYIEELYRKGVRNFIGEYIPESFKGYNDVNFILVPKTLQALSEIGLQHRQNAKEIIAITGSRGKTTLKEMIFQLLEPDFNISRSPRSFNSKIGVPLSLWQISPNSDIAIIEAGISKRGEMANLRDIIQPDTVIFTNIGDAHSHGFDSMEEKAREKSILADSDNKSFIIYPWDNPLLRESIKDIVKEKQSLRWSTKDKEADLFIVMKDSGLDYIWKNKVYSLDVKIDKEYDLENIAGALALMLKEGIKPDDIAKRFKNLQRINTKLKVSDGINGCSIILDSYTSDFSSLLPAIDFMKRRKTLNQDMTLIISDLFHEGRKLSETYEEIARIVRETRISRFIGVGESLSKYSELYPSNSKFYKNTDLLLKELSASDFNNEIILLKGASEFKFERIYKQLEAKSHETVLEVNLDAMLRNYNYFRKHIASTTGIIAMVKASGYGAGSYEIAKTLQDAGASFLAVAALDEGVDLRQKGIKMPIMVMNPRAANYTSLFNNRLEPVIYSMSMLETLSKEAKKYGIGESYPVHIKLDTGMHRMGFEKHELKSLINLLYELDNVKVVSIFSHLATADCLDMDFFTHRQLDLFELMSSEIISGIGYPVKRHILNSAGILRFPENQYDLVRLGIGLYGANTLPTEIEQPLYPVSSLRTVVICVREVSENEAVGYGRKGSVKGKAKIATIPIGYADGMNRKFGNGAIQVLINGEYVPTIGNICMDATMIDVTGVDCKEGDSVEIFGENIPLQNLADTLDTIPYEILTSVSPRVKRVYYRE